MITPATVAVGERIWRAIAPVKLVKQSINKRRARRGKPLLTITEEDYTMLPQGKATYTGAGLGAAAPFIGFAAAAIAQPLENAIVAIGAYPAACAPDAPGCTTAGMVAVAFATGIVTSVAAWVVAWGRKRAEARHQATLAALQAPQEPPR